MQRNDLRIVKRTYENGESQWWIEQRQIDMNNTNPDGSIHHVWIARTYHKTEQDAKNALSLVANFHL